MTTANPSLKLDLKCIFREKGNYVVSCNLSIFKMMEIFHYKHSFIYDGSQGQNKTMFAIQCFFLQNNFKSH